ncbi:MAG: hypothetical protein E6Q97_24060 [Desulfurellales bacterium]|nr:MAG: hypothetical protein E6Q97_24060 [Desulfurellales bacterium]
MSDWLGKIHRVFKRVTPIAKAVAPKEIDVLIERAEQIEQIEEVGEHLVKEGIKAVKKKKERT